MIGLVFSMVCAVTLIVFSSVVMLAVTVSSALAMRRSAMRDVERVGISSSVTVVIAVLLFFPIFFQVGSGVFRSQEFVFDSGRALNRLPIPISTLACYGGILLVGKFSRANLALATIFFSFVLMVLSTLMTSREDSSGEQAKLILMMQFILPMFGLVLGQMYGEQNKHYELLGRVLVVLLWSIVPAQLLAS